MAYFDDSVACDIYEDILKQTLLFQHIRTVSGDACIEQIGKGLVSLRNGLHARVWHPGLDACLVDGNPYGTHEMAHDIIWKDLNECLNNSYNSFLGKQYSRALDCVCYALDLFIGYIDNFEISVSMVEPHRKSGRWRPVVSKGVSGEAIAWTGERGGQA